MSSPVAHVSYADLQPIKRAILSVSNKAGLVELAQFLASQGVEILSTGGTAKHLQDAGLHPVQISAYTESPEVMGGRVKSLHPRVHGGILMRGELDAGELAQIGGKPIDLVVVNLCPFEQPVAKECSSPAFLDEKAGEEQHPRFP